MTHSVISEYYDSKISLNRISHHDMKKDEIKAHSHDVYEMIYLKSGDITYIVDEKIFNVKDNSLIITRPQKIHIIKFNDKAVYDRYDILFDEKIIMPEILGKISEEINVIKLKNPKLFAQLFDKTDYYCKHFEGRALGNILSHIIEEIFYNIAVITYTDSQNISYSKYETNNIFARAIDYIDQNLTDNFGLEKMCNELYISKSYLHKLFLEHIQITPKKYIISKRMIMAQKALHNRAKPTEIYSEYGFSDYSSFYRSYKQYFGYAPSEEAKRKVIRTIEY